MLKIGRCNAHIQRVIHRAANQDIVATVFLPSVNWFAISLFAAAPPPEIRGFAPCQHQRAEANAVLLSVMLASRVTKSESAAVSMPV